MRTAIHSIVLVVSAAGSVACRGRAPQTAARVDQAQLAQFASLPTTIASPENPITEPKVALGRMLFFDTRLSRDRDISCNSCHNLNQYGVDGTPVSKGFQGKRGARNAPTVYNAAGHVAQFWDGRSPSVEEQAKGPILNPIEMAMPSGEKVMARLQADPRMREAFHQAFPGQPNPITYDNLGRAIGAYERTLVTPAPWDRYLNGDKAALTETQLVGFNEFVGAGCGGCHRGAYLGGEMYQKAGLVRPWPELGPDVGREAVTHRLQDRMVFKVPSLRNITETGPYFHSGSVASIDEAVRLMALHQVGRTLTPAQVTAIVGWLQTLKGTIPEASTGSPPVD